MGFFSLKLLSRGAWFFFFCCLPFCWWLSFYKCLMTVRFSQSGLLVISKKRLPDQSSRTFSSSPKMVLWLKGPWTSVDLVLPSAVWFVCFQYLHCWRVEKNDCTALLKYSVLFGFADRWAEYSTVNAGNILHISCRYCGTCQLEFNRSNAIEDCWNLGR